MEAYRAKENYIKYISNCFNCNWICFSWLVFLFYAFMFCFLVTQSYTIFDNNMENCKTTKKYLSLSAVVVVDYIFYIYIAISGVAIILHPSVKEKQLFFSFSFTIFPHCVKNFSITWKIISLFSKCLWKL